MIGKLRQVSEFELAKFKANPSEMVRTLAAAHQAGDPQAYARLRENLQQSPLVQKMMEMSRQGKPPTREQQLELQQQMQQLLQQARDLQKTALSKTTRPGEPGNADSAIERVDLHKSWHCLHFLFTGKVEGPDGSPLGDAILGGQEIGGEAADTGYGPPRALSPSRVRSVAGALNEFPIDQKVEQFDSGAAEKAGIYVPRHGPQELRECFVQLRNFYDDAARKGNAVLLWIE